MAARRSGRRGRIYLGATNGAVATPISYQSQWSITFAQEPLEVTAMGDSNKQYVADLADSTGSFNGFDDGTNGVYTAATDGLSRKFYLYPDTSSITEYYYGEILVTNHEVAGGVGAAVTNTASWSAASNITHVPAS